MRSGTCYVLAGACRYRFGPAVYELARGSVTELPAGDYKFEVVGDRGADIVLVWLLPMSVGN
jgi:hypothetical protein